MFIKKKKALYEKYYLVLCCFVWMLKFSISSIGTKVNLFSFIIKYELVAWSRNILFVIGIRPIPFIGLVSGIILLLESCL